MLPNTASMIFCGIIRASASLLTKVVHTVRSPENLTYIFTDFNFLCNHKSVERPKPQQHITC